MRGLRIPLLALALTLILPGPVLAQAGSWLDGDLASWSTPGMTIPAAPAIEGNPDPAARSGSAPPTPRKMQRSSPRAGGSSSPTNAAGVSP